MSNNPVLLTLPLPTIHPDVMAAYTENLAPYLPVEEVVSMVVFIEYFSEELDREVMRADYIANVLSRYSIFNVNRCRTDEELLEYLIQIGKPIPFTVSSYRKGWREPAAVSFLGRIRKRYQAQYLKSTESLDLFYNAIWSFYSNSPVHHNSLNQLSEHYIGFLPKVIINRDGSLGLMIVQHSVI